MSVDFSRRQSLKMMAAAVLLSALPLGAVSARGSKHAFVITSEESKSDAFGQAVNESIKSSSLRVNLKNYESFLSLSELPKGALLIGLVNEAEKVLIDALVQNRKGIIKTTNRVSANSSIALIPNLADMTVNSALSFTNDSAFDEVQNRNLTSGSLISFYAYL